MDQWLEAPYILASGLGPIADSAPTGRESIVVVGATGVVEVDGSGETHTLSSTGGDAITCHPDQIITRAGDTVRWGPLPDPGQTLVTTGEALVPGADDLQAWYGADVLVTTPTGIVRLNTATRAQAPFGPPVAGVRGITIQPERTAIVVTADAIHKVTADASEVWAIGLVDADTVAMDAQGRAWVTHNRPRVLAVVDRDGPQTVARYLDQPVSLHFGAGGLLRPDNAYMSEASGTVEYVQVPPKPNKSAH
jgi:hypothetical protein